MPGSIEQNVIMKIKKTDFISFATGRGVSPVEQEEKPYTQVMALLNTGFFYWVRWGATSCYDITRTFQSQVLEPRLNLPFWDRVDKRFYWNKHLQKDFIAYRLYDWCFPIICGFVAHNSLGDVRCHTDGRGRTTDYTLVSRRSRFRAGTRFNTRGVDDDGNVANFVETEHIIAIRNTGTLAFLQTRGSVPVFWNQSAPQFTDFKLTVSNLSKMGKITKKKIVIARNTQATTPAFQAHFKEQLGKYGGVVVVNLLAKSKAGESDLVNAYEEQIKIFNTPAVKYCPFDLNAQLKSNNMDNLDRLVTSLEQTVGYFFVTPASVVTHKQAGTIRTNCKDCLDRTNIVQARIAWRMLEAHLKSVNLLGPRDILDSYPNIATSLKTMWADNGDALSMQYAGSGSLKSTLTREGDYGLMGMLADGKKTMTRFVVNNFQDKGRQDVLDLLLGLSGPGATSPGTGDSHDDRIRRQVEDRKDEYSQREYRNVFVGTYNVGGVPSSEFNIDSWLRPPAACPSPDLYVLGIQEVVELTAQQIIATDSQIKHWEERIRSSLQTIHPSVRYVQLQSNQLVGLLMCIYVREDNVHLFRDVQSQVIKVGLQGLAGNKGGIGVRLLFCDTSFTFVTAHFAAGHGNVDDRISDYHDINNQARFGRANQHSIDDSDYSMWFGDFNFRIDLDDETIKRHVSSQNYSTLYEHDQLRRSMEGGRVFAKYREEQITFAPTYKYDFNSTVYDTSPKQRAPAWTDRIMWRNKQNHDLRPLHYGRQEILSSDHRPVSCYFQLQVTKVDKEKERQLRHQLYESQTSSLASSTTPNNIPGQRTSGGRPLPTIPSEVIQEMVTKRRLTGGSESLQVPEKHITSSSTGTSPQRNLLDEPVMLGKASDIGRTPESTPPYHTPVFDDSFDPRGGSSSSNNNSRTSSPYTVMPYGMQQPYGGVAPLDPRNLNPNNPLFIQQQQQIIKRGGTQTTETHGSKINDIELAIVFFEPPNFCVGGGFFYRFE
eukprot:gene17956-21428_t